jgi:hypothetical protein
MTELDPKKSAFILGSTLLAPFVFGGSWLLGYLTDQIGLYGKSGYVDTYNVFRPSAWPFSIAVISVYIVYVIILYRYKLKEKKSSNFSLLYAVTSVFVIAAVTLILKGVMYGTGHN